MMTTERPHIPADVRWEVRRHRDGRFGLWYWGLCHGYEDSPERALDLCAELNRKLDAARNKEPGT